MTETLVSEENRLIDPHGGTLVDLIVDQERGRQLESEARNLAKWVLTARQLCDIEQLLTGAFSPLRGFMNRADYQAVLDEMRLSDGTLWPMPIMLDLPESVAVQLDQGDRLALMHPEGVLIAVLTVNDVWNPDKAEEAQKVFGTTDTFHPGVNVLVNDTADYYVGGTLEGVRSSQHHTYGELRHTPSQLRADFQEHSWSKVVAFQTRNPMHRAHVELTRRAAAQVDANLLIHPVVGLTKPGDVEYHTRVRCYRAILDGYPANSATLSLLQLAMRMGGPREAVWHAIVRKNYGCSHFIVGRDHAGPGNDANGQPFYGPYDAQHLVEQFRDELGIDVVTFQEVVYDGTSDRYMTRDELEDDSEIMNLSGTELRNLLQSGDEIPEWFSFPSVISELRKSYPAMQDRGLCILVVDGSVNRNASISNALTEILLEDGRRPVTVLDGVEHSSQTISLVAREASRNGGAVIVAASVEIDDDEIEALRASVHEGGVFISAIGDGRNVAESDVCLESNASPGDCANSIIDHLRSLGLIA